MTLHFRRAPEHKDWVVAFAERQHATRGLLVHPGRLERELRPAIDVDKGTVVRALVAEHDEQHEAEPLRALAAFGDDVGDLPAFAALEALRDADGRAAASWCGWPPSTARARPRWLRRRICPCPAPAERWRCCVTWPTPSTQR